MKRTILTCLAFVLLITLCFTLISCFEREDRDNTNDPSIHISEDGYWIVNGVKTNTKAGDKDGVNGATPTVEVSDDGYWVINGIKTDVKAEGDDDNTGEQGSQDDKDDTGEQGSQDAPDNSDIPEEKTYTVTFDPNGGSDVAAQTVSHGNKATNPLTPTREGYTFEGWYFGDEKWSFIGYSVTEDITLTAKWKTAIYTVTIDEGDNGKTYTLTLEHGEKISDHDYQGEPYKYGYSFMGWMCNDKLWSMYTDVVTSDMTIVAKWEIITYTVTYNLNGGTNHPDNVTTFTVNDLPIYLEPPTNENFAFLGWFNDEGMTSKYTTINHCRNITLYASWSGRPWGETTLIMEISENSNNSELASTSRRYLAGDMSTIVGEGKHALDTLVSARNAKAYKDANVKIQYTYLPDTAKYAWGQNYDRINEQVIAAAASSPDIYCNFVYDMVAASLKSSFANLLSTTMYPDGHELAGAEHNYFAFEDEIDIEDDGKNYMLEYMRSLTLSKYKMYLLASDYFIDVMRAAYVVPVNITMLESIAVDAANGGKYNSDRADAATGEAGKDGKFTIEDFYQLVYDGDWTYETLAAYSQAIYSNTNTAIEGKDLQDRLGFALATSSGLSASGMLYSTSVKIIYRTFNPYTGNYTHSYPGAEPAFGGGYQMAVGGRNTDLENFATAITDLFKTDGVLALSNEDASAAVGTADALLAIRSRFASNNLLFGGVICLGSLEYDEYKAMSAKGRGYGIAPVPVLNGEYNTQIHNIGRIGAISYTTRKFAQCTAFLNYQSMYSNEILNTYLDHKLLHDVGTFDFMGNGEMLKYIRSNIGSSLDKAYEDALGIFYSESGLSESRKQIWHYIIKDSGYTVDGEAMRSYYASYAPIKAQRLYDLEKSTFPCLPA